MLRSSRRKGPPLTPLISLSLHTSEGRSVWITPPPSLRTPPAMAVCTTLGEASLRSSSPWAAPQGSDPRLLQAVVRLRRDGLPRPDLRLVQAAKSPPPPPSSSPLTLCAALTRSLLARPASELTSLVPSCSALVVLESLSSEKTTRASPTKASRSKNRKRHPTLRAPLLPPPLDSLTCRQVEVNELATLSVVCSPP